jgi:hypothetical protein
MTLATTSVPASIMLLILQVLRHPDEQHKQLALLPAQTHAAPLCCTAAGGS